MTFRGFTLVELLISITLLGIIGASGFTMWQRAQQNQALSASARQLASMLENAHNFARDFRQERAWGVESGDPDSYELFSVDTAGMKTIEEEKSLLSPIQFFETFSVLFDAGTGKPDSPVLIVLGNTNKNYATVKVNEMGTVVVEIK